VAMKAFLMRLWWFVTTLTAPIWFVPLMLTADFVEWMRRRKETKA